jgi:hypothetical protein
LYFIGEFHVGNMVDSFFLRNHNRNLDRNHGTFIEIVLNVNAAVHFGNDVVAYPQPETGTLARFLCCEKWIESIAKHIIAESGAVVLDGHHDLVAAATTGGFNRPAAADGVDRIGEQV